MYCGIEITGTFIGIEVDWNKRITHGSKSMTLPISYDISLHLLIAKQLNIHHYFSIKLAFLIHKESTFEKTHLIDIDELILDYFMFTTLRITNLRVKNVLLFPSISEVFVGSKLFLVGLLLLSGYDLKVKNGTANTAV
jgi:hypothetical protein